MKTYLIYKNGFLVKKMESASAEDVVKFCDEYASQNPSDWVSAKPEGGKTFFKTCVEMGEREVY